MKSYVFKAQAIYAVKTYTKCNLVHDLESQIMFLLYYLKRRMLQQFHVAEACTTLV